MPLSIRYTVLKKVEKISYLLTCLCSVYFRGMTVGFLSCRCTFIALHSVRYICASTHELESYHIGELVNVYADLLVFTHIAGTS